MGQLRSYLDRTIEEVQSSCLMADPFSNGNDVNANDSMRKTLNRYDNELDYAYEKWKIRVNQLINEDLEDVMMLWQAFVTKVLCDSYIRYISYLFRLQL